jgi:hypothetical protein
MYDRLLAIPTWTKQPRRYGAEIRHYYQQALLDLEVLRSCVDKIKMKTDSLAIHTANAVDVSLSKIRLLLQNGYTFLVIVVIFLNAVLYTISIDKDPQLIFDHKYLRETTTQLAEEMVLYLSLYASYMSMTLECFWRVERDVTAEEDPRLWSLLRTDRLNALSGRWMEGSIWLNAYLTALRGGSLTLAIGADEDANIAGDGMRDVFAESEASFTANRCIIL